MSDPIKVGAVVFDAYGTLFNVHAPTTEAAASIGDAALAEQLGKMWRDKQLQYSWLRACMDEYKPFWEITEDALDYCLDALKIYDRSTREQLLDLYFELAAYPDAKPALTALRSNGLKTAILTNGSKNMISSALVSSGLDGLMDHALSVEDVGTFKPVAKVYDLAKDTLDLPVEQIGFVSCNGWDAWGSAHFGFQTVWLNRFGLPKERLPGDPKEILPDMTALPKVYAPL